MRGGQRLDKIQVPEVRKEAEFLCLVAAQVFAEEYAEPSVAGIFSIGANMRMIKRREMVVMIIGPVNCRAQFVRAVRSGGPAKPAQSPRRDRSLVTLRVRSTHVHSAAAHSSG